MTRFSKVERVCARSPHEDSYHRPATLGADDKRTDGALAAHLTMLWPVEERNAVLFGTQYALLRRHQSLFDRQPQALTPFP